ncbi:MAG: iron-containing alcohol dehydrogenase, partial [Ktedonobacteraceae bacterium]
MVATATTTTTRTMAAAMISPRRYIQGRGVLSLAGEQIAPLGNSALLIADNTVWQVAGHTVENYLRATNIRTTGVSFLGEASENEINRITEIGRNAGVNVVVGIGGGKTLDTAKAVGYR